MRKVSGVKKAALCRFAITNYGTVVYDAKLAQWHDIVESVSDEHIGFEGVKDMTLSKDEARRFIDLENGLK